MGSCHIPDIRWTNTKTPCINQLLPSCAEAVQASTGNPGGGVEALVGGNDPWEEVPFIWLQ